MMMMMKFTRALRRMSFSEYLAIVTESKILVRSMGQKNISMYFLLAQVLKISDYWFLTSMKTWRRLKKMNVSIHFCSISSILFGGEKALKNSSIHLYHLPLISQQTKIQYFIFHLSKHFWWKSINGISFLNL